MTLSQKTIETLVDEIEKGEIGIPKGVQRGFIWDSRKVLKLADSLYRKYPIGIIILWDISRSAYGQEIATGIVRISEEAKPKYLVVDGLQRLTSFILIKKGKATIIGSTGEYKTKRLSLYFNPETEEFSLRKREGTWFKVSDVLSKFEEIVDQVKSKDHMKKLIKLREMFSTNIPIYELSEDTPLDDLVEIFDRINSAGTKVLVAHLVTAYLPDLATQVLNFLEKLEEEGYPLKITTPIKTLSYRVVETTLVSKLREYIAKSRDKREEVRKKLFEEWEKTGKAIRRSIEILGSELYIRNSKFIPSETSFSTLAILVSKINDLRIKMGPGDTKSLALWMLIASHYRRYTGSTETRMDEDIRLFTKELQEKNSVRKAVKALVKKLEEIYGTVKIKEDNFKYINKQNIALLYFALCKNDARDLDTGAKISSLVESRDYAIHHIFPREKLKEKKYSLRQINDIANLTILSKRTNASIGNKEPKVYLSEVLRREEGKRILESHFIPLETKLWEINNYPAFLNERRKLILNFINSEIDELLKK